jgi:hypothetical protein
MDRIPIGSSNPSIIPRRLLRYVKRTRRWNHAYKEWFQIIRIGVNDYSFQTSSMGSRSMSLSFGRNNEWSILVFVRNISNQRYTRNHPLRRPLLHQPQSHHIILPFAFPVSIQWRYRIWVLFLWRHSKLVTISETYDNTYTQVYGFRHSDPNRKRIIPSYEIPSSNDEHDRDEYIVIISSYYESDSYVW